MSEEIIFCSVAVVWTILTVLSFIMSMYLTEERNIITFLDDKAWLLCVIFITAPVYFITIIIMLLFIKLQKHIKELQ